MVDVHDIAKSREAEYFNRKERELIEKLRVKAQQDAERSALAGDLGVADESILETFNQLGFNRESLQVLHLMPMLQVAWIDGKISNDEKLQIHKVAEHRGVSPGSPAWERLEQLLSSNPGTEFFDASMRIIRAIFEVKPSEQRDEAWKDLVAMAQAVAEASGGFLGLGSKVSDEEREVIGRVAREFEGAHTDAARKVTDQG